MKHKLFSEIRTVYETTLDNPHTFRVTIKTKDMVDGTILRHATGTTVKRYLFPDETGLGSRRGLF